MQPSVQLHADAPAKPREGQACNGCGVCCAGVPCALGMLASRSTRGACAALQWRHDAGRCVGGLITQPEAHLPHLPGRVAPAVARLARRPVSASWGCDCNWQQQA